MSLNPNNLKTKAFEFEGVTYTIRRLSHDEIEEITDLRERKQDFKGANKLLMSICLIDPAMTKEALGKADATFTGVLLEHINTHCFLPVSRVSVSLKRSSEKPAEA